MQRALRRVRDWDLVLLQTLRKSLLKVFLLALLVELIVLSPPSNAAGSKPVLNINCGQIVGGIDENGTYGLFKPDVIVRYYGSPLKITAFFYRTPTTAKSETGKTIVTITGSSSSSRLQTSTVDFERKILEYSQPQTGYYKILFKAVDSLKRKGSFSCLYKDYYFSTPPQSSTGSGSFSGTYRSSGFNKSNCTFNGKKLYGRVYFTKYSFDSDFKVYVSDYSFDSDLKVFLTDYSFDATSCGKWYPTKYSFDADFRVYLTSYSFDADFKIYETDYSFDAGR